MNEGCGCVGCMAFVIGNAILATVIGLCCIAALLFALGGAS